MAKETKRLESLVQTALFLVFLALPLLDQTLGLDRSRAPFQRSSAERPGTPSDLASLAAWPDRFDGWYRHHFGWRSWLIRRFHQANFLLFRVSESRQVVVGRDGWLFFGDSAAAYALRSRPFSEPESRRWRRSLRNREQWLGERGVVYLFTLAPNKHSIYPEKLPPKLTGVDLPSRYEELARLLADTPVGLIDLHGPLAAAKAREQVYERSGSHWNSAGAYVAYREILDRLRESFPALEAVPRERVRMAEHPSADLAHMLALERFVAETRLKPAGGVRYPRLEIRQGGRAVTRQDDPSLPKAVIIHDSFGVSLAPYLAEHFRHAIWLWQPRFDGSLVERLEPDVVLEIRAERHLMRGAIRNVFPPEPS